MPPLHICHVITTLRTGGAEMMLLKLVTAMTASRHSVICLDDGGALAGRIAAAGARVHRLNLPERGIRRAAAECLRRIRQDEPDIVQGWMYHGNMAAGLARLAAPRSPVLWNIRATVYDLGKEKPGTARVIRAGAPLSRVVPRVVIYNSRVAARQHAALGYDARRERIIPNGFDCSRFAPSSSARDRVRQRLGVPEDALLVGLMARYHPMKDHQTFFEAAARVAAAFPSAWFVAAGTGVNIEDPALRQAVRDAGIGDRTRLLGEVTDVAELTAALDVACSTSAWGEGFPNVLGEAMASGVPCVATDVGDSALVMGDTGSAVPARDPQAFAAAVLRVLTLSAAERHALGTRARQRVLSSFSLESVAIAYQELYDGVARQ